MDHGAQRRFVQPIRLDKGVMVGAQNDPLGHLFPQDQTRGLDHGLGLVQRPVVVRRCAIVCTFRHRIS